MIHLPTQTKLPLDGVRVLDFGHHMAGPYCAMLLAQFGAEVIKVERATGDPQRHKLRPQGAAFGPVYRALNRGKTVWRCDLRDVSDRADFDRLLGQADIFVTNYRPSALRRLALDPQSLGRRCPNLVYLSLTGAGWGRACADQALDDGMAQALSGLMWATGWPEDGPVYCPMPIAALTSGLFGAIAAVSAYHGRLRGKRPAPVGVSMRDSLAFCLEYAFMHAANLGEAPKRNGGRHPTGTPSQVFATQDGLLAVMAPSGREFVRLCAALDIDALSRDERFATMIDRLINREALTEALERALARDTAWTWFERLSKQGVACAPVRSIDQVLQDPLVRERGLLKTDASGLCVAIPDGAVARQGHELADFREAPQGAARWGARDDVERPVISEAATGPLSGVSVVDLTRYLAGPFATTLLAELGATVHKVEPPEGDPARGFGPNVAGTSGYFASVNRGKACQRIDLKSGQGLAALRRLLQNADMLVENFRPGTLQKIGIDPRAPGVLPPGAHLVSISGYGQSGAFAQRAAFDMTVQAYCGVMAQTGYDTNRPTRLGFSLGDIAAGLFATLSAVTRLVASERGHPGGQADIAMADALYAVMESLLIARSSGAVSQMPGGAEHVDAVPHGAFPAQDGFVYLAAASDLDFIALWEALDLGSDLRPGDFGTLAARRARREVLTRTIAAKTQGQSRDALVQILSAAGVLAAPVLTINEALNSDYFRDAGLMVPHPDLPDLRVVRAPFTDLSDIRPPAAPRFNAPLQKEMS